MLALIFILTACRNNDDLNGNNIDSANGTQMIFCGASDPENATVLSEEEALSYLALVNRCYRVASDFSPEDLSVVNVESVRGPHDDHHLLRESAARATEALFQAALEDDFSLVAASGYRSYDLQTFYHNHAIDSWGLEEARRRSAIPGHSEHQLGLALDLTISELGYELVPIFSETSAGRWVNEQAHRFGFIVSFPDGREAETSIVYEPWHIRYVGVDVATEIFYANQILEEFLWHSNAFME